MRYDLIGANAIHGANLSATDYAPYEVRARATGRADAWEDAVRVGNEVDALYTNGPAGGGGVTKSTREVVAMWSTLIPRQLVKPTVSYLES